MNLTSTNGEYPLSLLEIFHFLFFWDKIKIFDVYKIKEKVYATPKERIEILKELQLDDSVAPFLGIKKIGGMSVAGIP